MKENSWEKNLIYDVLYKTLISVKPFCVTVDKVDTFVRDYHGTKYLAFFGSKNNKSIFKRIGYLIIQKSSISYVVSIIMEISKLI